jgi:diguanylate cyclase (GGDEF)-like protein
LSEASCEAEQTPGTVTNRSPTSSNPLRSLPSALAIADVQRIVFAPPRGELQTEDELVAALQLDPLAVVRGLRAAYAPVFRQSPSLPSVRAMVRSLGPAICRRLLVHEGVPLPATSPLRALWHRAIATAMAAEQLAAHSTLLDPEAAYLGGLLLELPTWLQLLRPPLRSNVPQFSANEWIAHWQLPPALVGLMHSGRPAEADASLSSMSLMSVPDLMAVAQRLAQLAGFTPPATERPNAAPPPGAATVDRVDQEAAARLRDRFTRTLAAFGLEATAPPHAPGTATAPVADAAVPPEPATDAPPATPAAPRARLDELILTILGFTRSERYLGIVTALTAAALRHGGFDRVFYAKWNPQTATVTLRAKADSSARRMTGLRHKPNAQEAQVLRTALAEERPVRLEATPRGAQGLLTGLSADEVLAVPLNVDFRQPAFLLLDRTLSLAPIDFETDGSLAVALGRTGGLLNENLLLRRRRQRAQKSALTDPLTHLYNRRLGLLTLDQEVARAERSLRPLTVLMCDLDHFKQLNDSLGHLQGDHALRATADVLRQTLRKSDTICRYGGEEFLIVLPDTTPAEATVLAARLFTSVHQRGEELGMPISISVGLTTYRAGDTGEAMLQRADHALFASKGFGRNRFSADVEPLDEDVRAV